MIQEKTQRVADLDEQLSEALVTGAMCGDEIRAIVRTELDGRTLVRWGRLQDTKPRSPPRQRPLVDSSTFSVFWAGPVRRRGGDSVSARRNSARASSYPSSAIGCALKGRSILR